MKGYINIAGFIKPNFVLVDVIGIANGKDGKEDLYLCKDEKTKKIYEVYMSQFYISLKH